MNGSSSFSEYVRVCVRRAPLFFAMISISFVVAFVWKITTTKTQYVIEGSIRISPSITAQQISDQYDLYSLTLGASDTATALIKNSDTIGEAFTACHLTNYDPGEFKERVSAERINGSDIIRVTVVFDDNWNNATVFTKSLLDIACEKIALSDIGGAKFNAEIVEDGIQNSVKGNFWPSVLTALMAALGAAALFLLIELVSFATDKTLRSSHRFEKFSRVPVIAAIPSTSRLSSGDRTGVKINNAYHILRSAVKYSKNKVRSVAVCSAIPKEGRTSVAIGLATALAETDAMVLLLEADMRRPNISMEMHIESTFGLADLLLGKTNLAATICKTSNRNLYVITAINNTNLSNISISDLLDSAVFDELLEAVQGQFDYVIIDTPSIETAPDATSVIGKVDCAVAVAKYDRTKIDAFRSSLDIFTASGGEMLGIVTLNTPQRTGIFGLFSNHYKGSKKKTAKTRNLGEVFNMADSPLSKKR